MVTVKDVAKHANVSIATVSKVVNGVDTRISDETRRRVNNAIDECGYVPNRVARGLKTRKTNTIGFILPDIRNPFYSIVAMGIESVTQVRGFTIIFCNTGDNPENEFQGIEMLKSQMVEGIIFGTRMLIDNDVSKAVALKLPVVALGRANEELFHRKEGRIYIDEMKMVYDGTMKLAEAGCREIAMIGARENVLVEKNVRLSGYLKAMKELDRTVAEGGVFLGDYDLETGSAGVLQMVHNNIRFDGIVCGNDLIAIGALDELRKLHLSVPVDVKLVGFDDIPFAAYTNPRLSTIAQPAYQMGAAAANMLIDHIINGTPLGTLVFEHTFVGRETI